jgi:hypothetical protein
MNDEQAEQPTEEELQAAFEEQMRQIRVQDVILQSVATLVNLGGRRLGLAAEPGQDVSGEVDLEQARLAIDAARALAPMCPDEQTEPIRQALSQLQMAFAQAAPGQGSGVTPSGSTGRSQVSGDEGSGPAQGPSQASPEDDERAKARAKLWTPPGA